MYVNVYTEFKLEDLNASDIFVIEVYFTFYYHSKQVRDIHCKWNCTVNYINDVKENGNIKDLYDSVVMNSMMGLCKEVFK